ncbi:hypothetical protein QYF53_23715 [Paenibacillus polymyxa]|nr:hypothetical protein [Paenibacillus polymyxa]
MEYTFKDLSMELDVSVPNLRRWCTVLEEMGYIFERSEDKRRLSERDRDIIEKLIRMKQSFKIDEACRILALYAQAEQSQLLNSEQPRETVSKSDVKPETAVIADHSKMITAVGDFEHDLNALEDNWYWHGSVATLQQLSGSWENLKKEIGCCVRKHTP